jgi:hypothetical protein
MASTLKQSALVIVLASSFTGACIQEDAEPSAGPSPSPPTTAPDPKKPQLGAVQAAANGFVVTPSFTGPLSAGSNTLSLRGSTTLTIATNMDVGPTPYYIEIFDISLPPDAGIGTLLVACGSGTTCTTGPVSYSFADTHRFVAYVSGYGTSAPPPNVVATSAKTFVTWSSKGYTLSLPTGVGCVAPGTGQVTATSSVDVGPTPYYIEIFDPSGSRLNTCGYGTTCTATFMCGAIGLSAFISDFNAVYPPLPVQASSNTVIPTVSLP